MIDNILDKAAMVMVVEKMDLELDKETIILRKGVCFDCPNNSKQGVGLGRCEVCKCRLNAKVLSFKSLNKKGKVEVTHCPEGRWGDEFYMNYYGV